jgi:hypothetical protein
MNQPIQFKATATSIRNLVILIGLALACFALSPIARAVSPAPDGGYPGSNTAEGTNALFSRTTGIWNTAIGYEALYRDSAGNSNTAVGLRALYSNATGNNNTATGVYALYSNTAGVSNTAHGYQALVSNSTGSYNTATGYQALSTNNAPYNTANGYWALYRNTNGSSNVAVGYRALQENTTGIENTAVGSNALQLNQNGFSNAAVGNGALFNNSSGVSNTAIGHLAGHDITGNGNVCIGADVVGVAGESNTTRIKNIYSSLANARAVYVNADDKLGTLSSSRRYKEQIKPMDKVSETILALKPVSFRYKAEVDGARTPMFGLIAEEVEKVNPDLVGRNEKGEVETVRYDAVNAMLLNEFIKEHQKVQKLEAALKAVNKRLKEQDAKIDKVNAKVELTKPAPQTVENR